MSDGASKRQSSLALFSAMKDKYFLLESQRTAFIVPFLQVAIHVFCNVLFGLLCCFIRCNDNFKNMIPKTQHKRADM